jgi:hypothetical protein
LLGGGTGLFALLKWLKGRKPSKIEFKNDKAIFILEESEAIESFEVDLVTSKLYKSRVVRQSIAKVIKPLERDGVDYFAAGRDGKPEIVIDKNDAQSFFVGIDDSEIVSESVIESTLLQIESAVFKDGNKWRFTDGTNAFYAEISDPIFTAKIESGEERFGKGDVLHVNLQKVQTVSDSGLKSDYKILKVLEHRYLLQPPLFTNPRKAQ